MAHKKAITHQQAQKHLAAQYRSKFFRKLKHVIDEFGGNDIYPLIPQKVLDDIYLCRSTPFKYVIAVGSNVPSNIYNDAKAILPNMLRHYKVMLQPKLYEMTLFDYFTVNFTIFTFYTRLKDTDFNNANRVKEALHDLVNDNATNQKANEDTYLVLQSFGFGQCDLRKCLYWYKHDYHLPKSFPAESENIIYINTIIPENITIEIDGIQRPAIRLGWAFPYTGAEWLSIKPSALNFKGPLAEMPVKVYIQSHALNRLAERIDCFETGMVQYNMYSSLVEPKIFYDNNNNILIEYKFFNAKAGYFRADLINGIILIRTFLFITNNGTPEGQLLEKNTGLQKLDKKYLAIDKLSTFMSSDIGNNEEVRNILKSSGCQSLLVLHENMQPLLSKKDNSYNFNLMTSYLNNNKYDNTITQSESALQ